MNRQAQIDMQPHENNQSKRVMHAQRIVICAQREIRTKKKKKVLIPSVLQYSTVIYN